MRDRMTAACEPTLPKPCTLIVGPSRLKRRLARPLGDAVHDALAGRLLAAERAAARDRLAGDDALHALLLAWPTMFMYVSIIQAMVWALVPTSGAGMSYSGPMLSPSAW